MTLINAFEAATPSPRACMVDAPVMGGTMAQMIDLVNHLGVGRSRRVIHANFTRGQATFADVVDDTDIFTPFLINPPSTETLEVPFLSSPIGRYLVLFLTVQASGTTPSLTVELFKLNTLGGAHTLIDNGVRWDSVNNRITPTIEQGAVTVYPVQIITTGAQVQPASGGVDDPRPLVIPAAQRGENLMVRLTCADINIEAVDVFELYEESWA